jgi:hypothetical protein
VYASLHHLASPNLRRIDAVLKRCRAVEMKETPNAVYPGYCV